MYAFMRDWTTKLHPWYDELELNVLSISSYMEDEHMIELNPMFDDQEEYIITMGMYPLCGAMCEALGIPEVINKAVGPRDPRAVLDVGLIVKAMIINILDERSPLFHFADAFRGVDCEVIFGEGVYADLFTEDRLGDALDLVSELDHRNLATSLSIRNLKLHGIPVHSSHIDTTNASLSGEFEVDEESDIKITFGKPKARRKDCKLLTFTSAVQQDGLPLFGEGLSGNASDVLWFREAMDEMSQFAFGDLNENPILIMDASGSTIETFNTACENDMPSVIRLSKRFNITCETIDRACRKGCWQEVGTVAEHNQKQAAEYRIYSEKAKLGKYPWRIVIVQSTALKEKKHKTAQRNLTKGRKSLEKKAESLAQKEFETPEKARAAAEKVLEERNAMQKLIDCEIKIRSKTIEKYARPGRPTKDSEKIKITTYHPQIIVGDTNKQRYEQWLEYNSCFALTSNVPEDRLSDQGILFEYKGQWKIENQFKFIKVNYLILAFQRSEK